jgi:hypothetical protein
MSMSPPPAARPERIPKRSASKWPLLRTPGPSPLPGAVAGAKKAGVGISNTDIVNFDETNASIGGGSVVKAQAADSGVKVTANAAQVVANVAVSAGIGTESTGVGGVLGIDLSMNKAEATIGEAAQVQAEGNVTVGATNDSVLVMIAGGVGGGKEVGVGAAVGINALWNRTLASIARDAVVDAKKNIAVTADADEVAVTAVVSGAGGGKAGVAASLAFNVILADTEASVGQGVKLNTSAGFGNAEKVAITARDDTVVVGVSGGGAGGGDAGVGAALDTDVVVKTVKAFIADDTVADGQVATIKADKEVSIDAAATEAIVSIGAGFAGGGKAGVGGSVAIAVVANDVQAYAGKSSSIDSDGNVLIRAQDDTTGRAHGHRRSRRRHGRRRWFAGRGDRGGQHQGLCRRECVRQCTRSRRRQQRLHR